jgi:3-deoxy-manno-octulosonate cytidylyltransferase (CMP-KDO synthetase)
MTADTHERASDRVAEAAKSLDAEIIVMVQGDEPMVTAGMVDVAVDPMRSDTSIQCVNLTKRINNLDEFEDPNTIKVVMDKNSDALYFSRVPVPSRLTGNIKHRYRSSLNQIPAYRQVCIIPFRQKALKLYSELSPTPLEIAESVDMMRFVEHGYKVRMIETNVESYAVDTPEDLAVVEQLMRTDPLVNNY